MGDWEAMRKTLKPFELADLAGRRLRSGELAGKVVVMDFWATWCGPCVEELPDLAAWRQRLAARPEIAFLSLDVGEDPAAVAAFLKRHAVSFPVYRGDDLVQRLQLSGLPTKLVIDMRRPTASTAGLLRFRREGLTPVGSIEGRLAELLAEKP